MGNIFQSPPRPKKEEIKGTVSVSPNAINLPTYYAFNKDHGLFQWSVVPGATFSTLQIDTQKALFGGYAGFGDYRSVSGSYHENIPQALYFVGKTDIHEAKQSTTPIIGVEGNAVLVEGRTFSVSGQGKLTVGIGGKHTLGSTNATITDMDRAQFEKESFHQTAAELVPGTNTYVGLQAAKRVKLGGNSTDLFSRLGVTSADFKNLQPVASVGVSTTVGSTTRITGEIYATTHKTAGAVSASEFNTIRSTMLDDAINTWKNVVTTSQNYDTRQATSLPVPTETFSKHAFEQYMMQARTPAHRFTTGHASVIVSTELSRGITGFLKGSTSLLGHSRAQITDVTKDRDVTKLRGFNYGQLLRESQGIFNDAGNRDLNWSPTKDTVRTYIAEGYGPIRDVSTVVDAANFDASRHESKFKYATVEVGVTVNPSEIFCPNTGKKGLLGKLFR